LIENIELASPLNRLLTQHWATGLLNALSLHELAQVISHVFPTGIV